MRPQTEEMAREIILNIAYRLTLDIIEFYRGAQLTQKLAPLTANPHFFLRP